MKLKHLLETINFQDTPTHLKINGRHFEYNNQTTVRGKKLVKLVHEYLEAHNLNPKSELNRQVKSFKFGIIEGETSRKGDVYINIKLKKSRLF